MNKQLINYCYIVPSVSLCSIISIASTAIVVDLITSLSNTFLSLLPLYNCMCPLSSLYPQYSSNR